MEIYAYGNVQAVIGALHFLVMLFGSGDFMDIVRTVIVIGFVVAACASVLQMTHRGWTWLLTVLVMYSILFIPKTSVLVTDKLGIEPPAAVANVPWFAGFVFSIKSQIGHTLVELTETALQTIPNPKYALPSELSYEQHGLAFGNRLIQASRAASLPDTQLRADLIGYFRNCVYPEIGKSLDPDIISKSTELWKDVQVNNRGLVTPYTPPLGTVGIEPCPDVYSKIDARLPGQLSAMMASFAMNMVPGLTVAAAVAQTDPAVLAAYTASSISGASTSASEILLNNAMLNHFGETGQIMTASTADPASVLMSVAKANATAQTNASNAVQAQMAELASPIVRNVLEIVLLGAFPVVCLMVLVSEGRKTLMVLIGYLYALVWIELWPFTFALLNYVHTLYAAREVAAAGYIPGISGMSLLTSGNIYATTLSTSGIAGWMIVAVPTLSAALLWGFDKIVGAVPSLGAMLGSAGSSAAEATVGNVRMSAVSIGQHSISPQKSSAWFRSVQDDVTGNTRTTGILGVNAMRALQNDTFITGSLQAQRATSLMDQATRAGESAVRESEAATTATTAAWGEALTKGKGRVSVQELGKVVGSEQAKTDAKQWQDVTSTASNYNRRWNVSESQAATIVATAKAGLSFDSIGFSGQLSNAQRADIKRDFDEIRSGATSQQAAQTQDFLRRLSTNEQYRNAVISSQEDRQQLSATFERAQSHLRSAEASLTQRDALVQSAQVAYTNAVSLGYDFAKDPRNTAAVEAMMQRVGGDPVRTQLVLDSELARFGQLSRPTRYADNTPVAEPPTTYQAQRGDPRVRDTTSEAHASNKVGLGPVRSGSIVVPSALAGAEGEITAASQAIDRKAETARATVGGQASGVDARLNRVDGPDGKFGTKTSLANTAGENLVNDVVTTNKEALKGIGIDPDRAVDRAKQLLGTPRRREE
ncbi:MAG TPA: conjugal transfer protein TraG N-terminal domain-containing protein [Burkholderiaceae bacterium]|nr:conjugal transfer protein TraG N-terminal domain-containing protein [Burkholderiaceae bacterium]